MRFNERDDRRGGYGAYGPPQGGHGGGRGYGRGGGGPRMSGPPATSLMVMTNCFQANYSPQSENSVWYRYEIAIVPKKRVKDKDRDVPWDKVPDCHPEKAERMKTALKDKGSTVLTRKILAELSRQLARNQQVLATDGAQQAISPTLLFEDSSKEFTVRIEDGGLFKVILSSPLEIPLGAWTRLPTTEQEMETVRKIEASMDILIKHAMNNSCIAVGKNPNTFFLPEEQQRQVLQGSNVFRRFYSNRSTSFAPFIGISQTAKFNSNGKFIVAVNNRVDWLYRGSQSGQGEQVEIPVLDPHERTLAGIKLPSLDQKIQDPALRQRITQQLSKMNFKVKYTKGKKWEEECRKRGKDDRYINKFRTIVKREQRIGYRRDKKEDPKLKWGCDEESFDKKEGDGTVTFNVQTYYAKIYDIHLRFPNMPIVCTPRGYFPVEFLYQEMSRVTNANDSDKIQEVLKYHDSNAGRARMQHIQQLRDIAAHSHPSGSKSLEELFHDFHIEVEREPVTLQAKRILAPGIAFGNGDVERQTYSGSWNLRDKMFSKGAELTSFAVVDLGYPGLRMDTLMPELLQSMEGHGIAILNNGKQLHREVTIQASPREIHGAQELYQKLLEAKERALDVFTKGSPLFKTMVVTKGGKLQRFLVSRMGVSSGAPPAVGDFYAIPGGDAPTHTITNKANNLSAKARMLFNDGNGNWVDPTQVPDNIRSAGRIGFKIKEWPSVVEVHEIEDNPPPLLPLEPWQIECPSILFVYLPEKRTDLYDATKAVSDLLLGMNTQCLVQETCKKQRRREQYCSNVALKLNTKLFSSMNDACAWKIHGNLPWVSEAPTMVMGYSLSHGFINGSPTTAIGGSVCLAEPIQMGQSLKLQKSEHKRDVVEPGVLKSLVTDLAINFFLHVGEPPKRMIVYRDGGSGGSFDRILEEEVIAIREAICDLNRANNDTSVPRITFVVAQTDHNMRFVPKDERDGNKGNVPSGTLVDDGMTAYHGLNSEDVFDFFLTPQGGLKGTSKPIHYHVLANENTSPPDQYKDKCSPLSKSHIQDMTYFMSFQYGSATKAPRKVPVLLNSEKMSSRAIKCGGYLGLLQDSVRIGPADESEQIIRLDDVGQRQSGHIFASYGVNDSRCDAWRVPFRPHVTA